MEMLLMGQVAILQPNFPSDQAQVYYQSRLVQRRCMLDHNPCWKQIPFDETVLQYHYPASILLVWLLVTAFCEDHDMLFGEPELTLQTSFLLEYLFLSLGQNPTCIFYHHYAYNSMHSL